MFFWLLVLMRDSQPADHAPLYGVPLAADSRQYLQLSGLSKDSDGGGGGGASIIMLRGICARGPGRALALRGARPSNACRAPLGGRRGSALLQRRWESAAPEVPKAATAVSVCRVSSRWLASFFWRWSDRSARSYRQNGLQRYECGLMLTLTCPLPSRQPNEDRRVGIWDVCRVGRWLNVISRPSD